MSDMQVCAHCNLELPHTREFFYKETKSKRNALRTTCIECVRVYNIEYRKNNKGKWDSYHKKYRLRPHAFYNNMLQRAFKKYGVVEQDIRDLQDKQKGCCAICQNSLEEPNIDHCHTTGKVRGLLCGSCNKMLGHAKDNTDILACAIQYLEESV